MLCFLQGAISEAARNYGEFHPGFLPLSQRTLRLVCGDVHWSVLVMSHTQRRIQQFQDQKAKADPAGYFPVSHRPALCD